MRLPPWFGKLQFVLLALIMFVLGINSEKLFMPWWLLGMISISGGILLVQVWWRIQ